MFVRTGQAPHLVLAPDDDHGDNDDDDNDDDDDVPLVTILTDVGSGILWEGVRSRDHIYHIQLVHFKCVLTRTWFRAATKTWRSWPQVKSPELYHCRLQIELLIMTVLIKALSRFKGWITL